MSRRRLPCESFSVDVAALALEVSSAGSIDGGRGVSPRLAFAEACDCREGSMAPKAGHAGKQCVIPTVVSARFCRWGQSALSPPSLGLCLQVHTKHPALATAGSRGSLSGVLNSKENRPGWPTLLDGAFYVGDHRECSL